MKLKNKIIRYRNKGMTVREITKRLDCSWYTVSYYTVPGFKERHFKSLDKYRKTARGTVQRKLEYVNHVNGTEIKVGNIFDKLKTDIDLSNSRAYQLKLVNGRVKLFKNS